jgi:hypothetical protein
MDNEFTVVILLAMGIAFGSIVTIITLALIRKPQECEECEECPACEECAIRARIKSEEEMEMKRLWEEQQKGYKN